MKTLLAMTIAALAFGVASAEAAKPLPGKYVCTLVDGPTVGLAIDELVLKASGAYRLTPLRTAGSTSKGTWKKKGKQVRFRGGRLGGDVATRKAKPVSGSKVQLAFKSYDGGKGISCLR